MKTIEEIKAEYAQKCAQLGDLVCKQRRLHDAAEHLIRQIEQLEQDARSLEVSTAPETTTAPTAQE